MRLRLANEIKGTAGAVIGFVAGILVSILALLIVAMTAGKDGEALALGLMFYVVPFGAVVGALAGVIAGSRGQLKLLVNGSAGVFVVVYVASLVVSAWRGEQAEQRLAATIEPDGCRNEYRGLTFTSLGGFVSFERLCGQASHGTMNLSLISNAEADSSKLTPRGAGNLLVLEVPESPEPLAFPGRTALGPLRDGRQVIRYDYRAHVVSQQARVGGVDFEFVPDSIP